VVWRGLCCGCVFGLWDGVMWFFWVVGGRLVLGGVAICFVFFLLLLVLVTGLWLGCVLFLCGLVLCYCVVRDEFGGGFLLV